MHNFNPPFAPVPKVKRQPKPKAEIKPVEALRNRYAGSLASRAKRVKPSMPKMPWDQSEKQQ